MAARLQPKFYSPARLTVKNQPMKIEGRITYQELEGGFWGIIGTGGDKYVPIERLPEDVQVDGLAIHADVEPVQMLGTTMWGTHVKINSISAKG